jgi:hypothetical protein
MRMVVTAWLLDVSAELIVGRGPALQKSNPFDGRWTLLKENPFSVQGILRICTHSVTAATLHAAVQLRGRVKEFGTYWRGCCFYYFLVYFFEVFSEKKVGGPKNVLIITV